MQRGWALPAAAGRSGTLIESSPISSTIYEKSELLHDRKCVRIFYLYQRHSILMPMPRGLCRPLGIFVLSALFRQRILLGHHEARHHLQTEQPWIETLNDGSFLGISFDIPSLVLFWAGMRLIHNLEDFLCAYLPHVSGYYHRLYNSKFHGQYCNRNYIL